jgi:16S rRNA C967 or C1407 C5-methylase (RsmB/RsmF family)
MCAAPGSKTSQILEMQSILHNREEKIAGEINEVKGGVVANDMNVKRASMLAHRVKLINTTGMAVINHEGQFIPDIHDSSEEKVFYDKVMVDVPCSGDGAIRKLPNRWKVWNSKDGMELHEV